MARSRKPIARIDVIDPSNLDASEADRLAKQLSSIHDESCEVTNTQDFIRSILQVGDDSKLLPRDTRLRLALFWGEEDELVGFSFSFIIQARHEGQRVAVIRAAVFTRRGYQGGRAAARFGMMETLRFKLRHPLTPVYFSGISTSPAPFVLKARYLARRQPSRHHAPDSISIWLREVVIDHHGYERVPGRPWVVKVPARTRTAARIESSEKLRVSPDAAFFLELAPDYATGQGVVVLAPLDLFNLFVLSLRVARRAVG